MERALGSVRKQLGRKDPDDQMKPSDRRVVRSNAASRAALSSQWDG